LAGGRRVVWSHEGLRTLEEVLAYPSDRTPDGARRVLDAALRAAASLSSLGERGRVVPEMATPTIRELFVRNYRLVHRVLDEEVVVLAFIHAARDFARWRRESGLAE
jgi:plasmid stabilization system protein ParE